MTHRRVACKPFTQGNYKCCTSVRTVTICRRARTKRAAKSKVVRAAKYLDGFLSRS